MTIPLSWGESTLDIDVRRGESTHPSPMHLPNLTWFRAPTNLWQGFRGATFQHFEHLRPPTISAAHECHSRDRSGEATPAEIVDRPGKNCDVVQTHLSSIRDMDTKKLLSTLGLLHSNPFYTVATHDPTSTLSEPQEMSPWWLQSLRRVGTMNPNTLENDVNQLHRWAWVGHWCWVGRLAL